MDPRARPHRSVLYIPASRPRALEKARTLPVDAIIFDLEDAVAPDEKARARSILTEALAEGGYADRARIVRINGFDTDWAEDDLAAIADAGAGASPDAIVLPKVRRAGDIAALADRLAAASGGAGPAIWAMMETPAGILNAGAIAAAPRMAGLVMGTNDLAHELGAGVPGALATARQHCLLAARAHGLVCVDGVYNAFRDEAGLRAECVEGRDWGMDGKTLIHPAQVAVANAVFAPSTEDIALARRQIEAYDTATARGEGVAVLDGRIVENLHVAAARATLARAESIRAIEGAAS